MLRRIENTAKKVQNLYRRRRDSSVMESTDKLRRKKHRLSVNLQRLYRNKKNRITDDFNKKV